MPDMQPVLMPSAVSQRLGVFDRLAGRSALIASRAHFFAFCGLLIVMGDDRQGHLRSAS